VTSSGAFETATDLADPDDSKLGLHPQLVLPINAAKDAIIRLAAP
jgi:hypothetical protein